MRDRPGDEVTVCERAISLRDHGQEYEGLLVAADARSAPGILIAPTIRGRTDFEENKARALAELGYAALVIDLYGVETRGRDIGEFRALMDGLRADRAELQRRLGLWLAQLREQAEVDADRTAAIGFCFGGLCVLDLARTSADIAGVVSFHGLFVPPDNTAGNRIRAKVLALHGWDDPLAPPDQVEALARELTAMGADWQIHAYGNTLHAFTNPAANDTQAGTVYDANADRRSWAAMQDFLAEVFGA